jgi:dTDP-4-dehydrorhamnose reductase
MKILLAGRTGQLGSELQRQLAGLGELVACDRSMMDLSQPAALPGVVRRHRPDLIINAAAYTAVDRAESEPELAFRVNAESVEVLAREARALGALLVHYSTDFVFDGAAQRPYRESDPTGPLSVYGASKLAGEQAIAAVGARHLILRTGWLYAARGSNFVLTMLRLARERAQLRVVDDQFGAPTWSSDLAAATVAALGLRQPPEGLFHVAAGGQASRWTVACRALQLAGLDTPVAPVGTDQFPTPARRPKYSVLDCGRFAQEAGFRIGAWDERLAACLRQGGIS